MKNYILKILCCLIILILLEVCLVSQFCLLYPQNWLGEHVERKIRMYKLLKECEQQKTQNQDQFDVSYYGINVSINPETRAIIGSVKIIAVSLDDSLAVLELNFSNDMSVDSILSGDANLNFTHVHDILQISLNRPYKQDELIYVSVHYHGQPEISGSRAFAFDKFQGRPMIWSLSEPFGARNWWPCKDVPSDKADSADIRVTVPKGLIVASNGLLKEVIPEGETETYWWHESYPITTYLVSVAIHNYHTYSDYFKYSESDSMEIQFYVFPEHLELVRENYAQTAQGLEFFSEIFGPYPFLKEKYGHAEFTWGGGMEHQTITSLGYWSIPLIVHELAHQWWGDMITCRDFHHIWLNEGFATYAEALYLERFGGKTDLIREMESNEYFGPGTIYVDDLSNVSRIFSGNLSYRKAAWVLHMLRHVLGDTTFFKALKTYGADPQFKYGTAVTEDFQNICGNISGMELGWFFKQWIYGEYYPIYFYHWLLSSQTSQYSLKLIIEQQQESGLFKMPIDITIMTEKGDTTFAVWDSLPTQTFEFVLDDKPRDIYLDRDKWILRKIRRPSVVRAGFFLDQNYPNPFIISKSNPSDLNTQTTIGYQISHATKVTLKIYNILGQVVRTLVDQRQPANYYPVKWDGLDVNGHPVPSGFYFYELVADGYRSTQKMTVLR